MLTLNTIYSSQKWRKFVQALRIQRQDADGNIICEECGKPIVRAYDCIGHHKIELTEENVNDATIAFNPENVALIHFQCHNKIHERWNYRKDKPFTKRQVWLVYGSPCAGKTTWAMENATKDDLIIDLDRIWEAITSQDREHKNPRLKANAFGVRDCLIDQVRTRKGLWASAYIIGGYPQAIERERLCDLLGARPIFIDTDKETCMERIPAPEWREYIEDWWEWYTE